MVFPLGQGGRGVKLTAHLFGTKVRHVELNSPSPHMPSGRDAWLSTGTTLPFQRHSDSAKDGERLERQGEENRCHAE